MRQYLKESFHWLHLVFFKPITLVAEAERLTRKEAVKTYLRIFPIGLAIILALEAAIGGLCQFVGYPFDWSLALSGTVVSGLVVGLVLELILRLGSGLGGGLVVGLGVGLVLGVIDGLVVGLDLGLGGGLVVGLVVGLVGGLADGLGLALGSRLDIRLSLGLVVEIVLGLIVGLGLGLVVGLDKGLTEGLTFALGYMIAFLLTHLRLFYLIPYAIQYWRAKKISDLFQIFRNSPVYWDEVIAMPLPYLAGWFVRLANHDRERGLIEIEFVGAKRPYQRRAAQKALIRLAVQELEKVDSLEKMASASQILKFIPSSAEYLPRGLEDARTSINGISQLAADYLTRLTPVSQMKVLEELRQEVENFGAAMTLVKPPVGPSFQPLAARWLDIVKQEQAECQRRLAFTPIPNPFVVGSPLQSRDFDLFKGRRDIIIAIEENIINPGQRPALLLYGRRRIGKTSTLLNLPRLLSSQFVPVFIDCQDAKWRDSDAAFCYHLVKTILNEFQKRDVPNDLREPKLEQFEKYTFTKLAEYLDAIENISRRVNKEILLTFDEYEKFEEGITSAKITREIFNQLRSIVQHRERIVVLFSGCHRFEEAKTVNWSDYLINVKTLELSFLSPEDARELITQPVSNMQYEPGVVERILDLTHCQPYLLQAVASALVNYLNSQKRLVATAGDLEVAVEKVLVTAQAYFYYTWTEDCTEKEREVLQLMAANEEKSLSPTQHREAFQSLCRKDILERVDDRYQFTIELFRRWILKNQVMVESFEQAPHLAEQGQLQESPQLIPPR